LVACLLPPHMHETVMFSLFTAITTKVRECAP
jgi:hypothetical protein